MKANAQTNDIQDLFGNKVFVIPAYQRSYAWTQRNWEDFWNDLNDAQASGSDHYWGTVTLRRTAEKRISSDGDEAFGVCEVVDGQQRITTIALFLLALSRCGRPTLHGKFLRTGGVDRLEPGGLNAGCWKQIVEGQKPTLDLRTNRLLADALEYFEGKITASNKAAELSEHLRTRTYVLEFAVPDESLAMRAFQSLNDRGKPLTLLEKAKSLLMYYSEQYLGGALRTTIHDVFGRVFARFDRVKEASQQLGVLYVASAKFDEDVLLQSYYHYFGRHAHATLGHPHPYDWNRSAHEVFDEFLRVGCTKLRDDRTKLQAFIASFLQHFDVFSEALHRLMQRAAQEAPLRKLLVMLGLDAALYPLAVGLDARGFLDDATLFELERLDVRLYKVSERSNRAGLYHDTISNVIAAPSADAVRANIRGYANQHVPDASFRAALEALRYKKQVSITRYILWEFEKAAKPTFDDGDTARFANAQLDHIWPQGLTISLPAHGFDGPENYAEAIDRLGNLALLESKLNAAAQNTQPSQKAKSAYQLATVFPRTRQLGYRIDTHGWTRTDIERSTRELVDFALAWWGASRVAAVHATSGHSGDTDSAQAE